MRKLERQNDNTKAGKDKSLRNELSSRKTEKKMITITFFGDDG